MYKLHCFYLISYILQIFIISKMKHVKIEILETWPKIFIFCEFEYDANICKVDVVRGMAYLHNEPNVIIHRDLKPR